MNNGDMCMLCQSLVGIIKVYRSEGYTEVSTCICTVYVNKKWLYSTVITQ